MLNPKNLTQKMIFGTILLRFWLKIIEKSGYEMILIEDCLKEFEKKISAEIEAQKVRQKRINEIFANAYNLDGIVSTEPSEKDICIKMKDIRSAVSDLISYAVGCVFGRYSLDFEGLIFAGGEWDEEKYKTFPPVKENIVVLAGRKYGLKNDLSLLVSEFIKTVFGEEIYEENMKFIAKALSGDSYIGSPLAVLDSYFLKDFYKEHVRAYSGRPIYWAVSSGRAKAFFGYIYYHRIDQDTIKYIKAFSLSAAEKAEEKKKNELYAFIERIDNIINLNPSIDFDAGIMYNYNNLSDFLAGLDRQF